MDPFYNFFTHGIVGVRSDRVLSHFVDEETEVKRNWSTWVYQGKPFVNSRIKNKTHILGLCSASSQKTCYLLLFSKFTHYQKVWKFPQHFIWIEKMKHKLSKNFLAVGCLWLYAFSPRRFFLTCINSYLDEKNAEALL